MPKSQKVPSLYNHDDRPFIATSWTSEGRNGQASLDTRNIRLPPLPVDDYDDADYAMPVDEDVDEDHEFVDEPSTLSGGLPGIQVLPKPRAKRYMNSVRCFFCMRFLHQS